MTTKPKADTKEPTRAKPGKQSRSAKDLAAQGLDVTVYGYKKGAGAPKAD